MRRWLATAVMPLLVLACTTQREPPAPAATPVHLVGAGSTFVEPFLTKGFYEYSKLHPTVSVEYRAVGSGAGIAALTNRLVDFAATDVPMTAAELAAAGGPDNIVEFPDVVGAVAVAFRLDGVDQIRLDGPLLARIYRGEVTRWEDPALASLNVGVPLPALPITVFHRSDSSGTSSIFTDYLSRVSPAWGAEVGQSKLPKWPLGTGAAGSEGMTNGLIATNGGLGYVDLTYLRGTKLKAAQIRNRDGVFVAASVPGASAAADVGGAPSPSRPSIVDQAGARSYPISGFSWIVIRRDGPAAGSGQEAQLFRWLVASGQQYAAARDYSPLPAGARSSALAALGSLDPAH